MATRNEKFLRAALGGARGWRLSEETKVPPPRHPRERPQASVGPGRKRERRVRLGRGAPAPFRYRHAVCARDQRGAWLITWQGGEAKGTWLQLGKAAASTWRFTHYVYRNVYFRIVSWLSANLWNFY